MNKSKRIIVYGIIGYLSILLIVSSIISIYQNNNVDFSREQVVEYAKLYLTDEELRAKGNILDCSGFVQQVYKHFNIEIPPSTQMQFEFFSEKKGDFQLGDLLYFSTSNRKIGHVGIYIGNNQFIHSPGKYKFVRIDSLKHIYWINKLVGFRSVFEQTLD